MKHPGKFTVGLILTICSVTGLCQQYKENESFRVQAETLSTGEYLKKWLDQQKPADLANTLVLLDLDDTVISTPLEWRVRPEIFYHLRAERLKNHPDLLEKEAGDYLSHLLTPVFLSLPYELTDNSLPGVINLLKDKGVIVHGFTARGQTVIPKTLETLKNSGIVFSKLLPEGEFLMPNNHSIHVQHGIVFIGHANTKGDALVALMQQKRLAVPKRTVLIDDKKIHLQTTAKSLAVYNKNIAFEAVLCTYPSRFKAYEEKSTKHELLHYIHEKRRLPGINKALISDKFTEEFVKSQCRKSEEKGTNVCNELLTIVLDKYKKVNGQRYEVKKAS